MAELMIRMARDERTPAVAIASSLQIEVPIRMKLMRAKTISRQVTTPKITPHLLKRSYSSCLENNPKWRSRTAPYDSG